MLYREFPRRDPFSLQTAQFPQADLYVAVVERAQFGDVGNLALAGATLSIATSLESSLPAGNMSGPRSSA